MKPGRTETVWRMVTLVGAAFLLLSLGWWGGVMACCRSQDELIRINDALIAKLQAQRLTPLDDEPAVDPCTDRLSRAKPTPKQPTTKGMTVYGRDH